MGFKLQVINTCYIFNKINIINLSAADVFPTFFLYNQYYQDP